MVGTGAGSVGGGALVGEGDGCTVAGGVGAVVGGFVGGRLVRGGAGAGDVGAAAGGAATVTLAWAWSWPIAAVTTAVPGTPALNVGPSTVTTSGREDVQTAVRASAGALPPLSSVPARVAVTDCPVGITHAAGVVVAV